MPVVHEQRSYFPPWAWIAIILGLILVVLVVWLVAAGNRDDAEERYGMEPAPTTPAPAPATPEPMSAPEQPQVVPAPDKDVHVYVEEREQATPNVIIIDRNESPPSGSEYRAVDVPGEFSLFGRNWRAEQTALVRAGDVDLVRTGGRIEGHGVYAVRDDERPYDALYIETSAGSELYVRYEMRS